MSEPNASVRELLNAQTGQLSWNELSRHFARGVVIVVHTGEDLITVAESLVNDLSDEVGRLQQEEKLHRAVDHDAIRWQRDQSDFWAVVVAPWVLVQEISAGDESGVK